MTKKKEAFTLTDIEDDICANIRARVPGIAITSLEEPQVMNALFRVASYMEAKVSVGREIIQWSACSVRRYKEVEVHDENTNTKHRTWTYEVTDPDGWVETLMGFAAKSPHPDYPDDLEKAEHRPAFLVLCDPAPFLDPKKDHADTHLRALREAMWRIREEGALKNIILVGGHVPLPDEIAADIYLCEYKLPTPEKLSEQFTRVIETFKGTDTMKDKGVTYDESVMPLFTRACAGLSEYAARSVFNKAIARYAGFDERAVPLAHREKEQIVKRSGIAEIQQPKGGMELVGGFEHFKEYVENEISIILKDPEKARTFGAPIPSGIMLMGVSGCGKSLVAEALGGHFNLPIMRMDTGSLFGKYVGESESRFRTFCAMADAVKPCLVFCDEFEKGLGGGADTHETTERFKQALLTWLQEKSDDIMFVATVNSIKPFERNPEILRSGRFDSIWFIDLPDARSRLEILGIHQNKSGHPIPDGFEKLAEVTLGYSGAELESAIHSSLRRALRAGLEHNTTAGIIEAVKAIVPLSVTMGDQLEALRQYVISGKARAAGALLDRDVQKSKAQDRKGLDEMGLPELFK
jgi:AAA+ superfamily predicted ATPase